MLLKIFADCSLNETPKIVSLISLQEFVARKPIALGSRSGTDGEYALVSLRRGRINPLREKVQVGLTRDVVRELHSLHLSF